MKYVLTAEGHGDFHRREIVAQHVAAWEKGAAFRRRHEASH